MRYVSGVLFLLCAFGFGAQAQAGGLRLDGLDTLPGSNYSTSSSTTTTEVIFIVGNTMSWIAVTTSTGASGGGPNAANRQRFLALHKRALATDMTVGGGPHLQDLSKLYGVPKQHFKAFAQHVRKDARQLNTLLTDASSKMAAVDKRLLEITRVLKQSVEGR